jgi:hypothetical protein
VVSEWAGKVMELPFWRDLFPKFSQLSLETPCLGRSDSVSLDMCGGAGANERHSGEVFVGTTSWAVTALAYTLGLDREHDRV